MTRRSAGILFLIGCTVVFGAGRSAAQLLPPSGVHGAVVSCSRIDLSWNAAPAAQSYRLFRNGVPVSVVGSPAAIQVALAASSSYSFAVSTIDFAGNESDRSAPVTLGTPACPDRTPPGVPVGLTAAASASCNRIDLAWSPVTDAGGSGLLGYRVYRNNVLAFEVPAPQTLAADVGLDSSSTYRYTVSSVDVSGNESAQSFPAAATTSVCAGGPPTTPNIIAATVGCTVVFAIWTSPDAPGAPDAVAYQVYRNGLFLTQVAAPTSAILDTSALPSTTYAYTVVGIDAAGVRSAASAPATATTSVCPDTAAPSVPTDVRAVATSCSQVQLTWSPSSDVGSGVRLYRVSRNGALVTQVLAPATSAFDAGLVPGTPYGYAVDAVDAAGNVSPASGATVTTPSCSNQPPIAAAGADRGTITLTSLTFSGAGSLDPDGRIVAWNWTFGDGGTASGVTVAHAWAKYGTYPVTLTVTDDDGATASDSLMVSVGGRAPTASAGPDRFVSTGDTIRFDGSSSTDPDGTIVGWGWSFGDGTTGSTPTPSHVYARPGTYTVTLTTTDDSGLSARDTATMHVANRPPRAVAGSDRQVAAGTALVFDGRSSTDADGTIVGFAWNFGDGQSGIGASVSHAYAAAGIYTATLTVTDDLGGVGTDTAVVTVTGVVVPPPPPPPSATPWAKRIGGAGYDEIGGIAVDPSGNVLVTGQTAGPFDLGGIPCVDSIFVAKYDPSGNIVWGKCFGGDSGGGGGRGIAVDSRGNIAVTGNFRGTVDFGGGGLASPEGYDGFIVEFGPGGQHLWSRRFGAPFVGAIVTDTGNGVAFATDGSVVVTGAFEGTTDFGTGSLTSQGQTDIFVAKYAANGRPLWAHAYGGPYADSGNAVALDGAGDAIVTGTFFGPADLGSGALASSGFDVFLAAYGVNGNPLWSESFGGILSDEGNGVAVDRSGNIALTGVFAGTASFGGAPLVSAGGNDAFLAKYDPFGRHLWSLRLGSLTNFDSGNAVAVDAQGDVAVAGTFTRTVDFGGISLTSGGSTDAFVARYSPLGVLLDAHPFGSTSIDSGNALAFDASGALITGGTFFATVDFGTGPFTSAGSADAFLVRLVP